MNKLKILIALLLITVVTNLLPQQNNISDEERRARIVEAYNRQLQMNENGVKGGEDPLPEAMTERFFTGQAAGDYFGWAISTAGDVNGDGYDDIIIGAYNNDAGGNNAGRAYIYFGGATMDFVADIIITGQAVSDFLGTSVSTAGDVNGDGYSDVIIGANGSNGGAIDGGRVYIYFGGETMDNIADITITGTVASNFLGTDVATAGDVNGDGYSDVIVATYVNNSNTGIAYIYFGGPSMDTTPDVTMTGEAAGNFFSSSISSAGDVNGDGYSDVIVGAYGNDGFANNAGRAYIYFGGAVMNNTPDIIMNGEAASDNFGISVSSAGDINSDGYTDVVVGAYLNSGGTGRAYIFLGGAAMDNIPDVVMNGQTAGDNFGISVSSAGDINRDAYSDVIVGANLNDAGGNNAGRAYVYYGGETMDNIKDVILTGEADDDRFGSAVALVGDVNGDGYEDMLVGAYLNNFNGADAGRAYLYLNSLTGPDIPDEFFTGENAGDQFGYSTSNAGDVNGDGFDDILVGVPYYDDITYLDNGIAYIYYGGPGMDNISDVTLLGDVGSNIGNNFGFSVSGAGDINGDGYDDIVVGAPYTDFGNTNRGTVSIFLGGNPMDGNRDFLIDGPAASNDETFGYSVSDAGDVNGDGFADIVVGGRGYNLNQGRAYVFYGGNPFNTAADVIMPGQTINDFFGWSVSSAGDVNGDGFSDVIVGAPYYDIGGNPDVGRAYIYYGNITMDPSADVFLDGESAGTTGYFGLSVSTAGDVNGDGYADVIVGAPYVFGSSGRAYIYFGGLFMDRIADVTLTPTEINSPIFGFSVSTAGDINGDSYADVIVGETDSDAGGQYSSGKAVIYFGGSSMDGLGDILMTGDAANIRLGNSVSTAGDINGDGYADVVVGAHQSDAGGLDAGRAYLYLSSSPPIKPRVMSVKDVPFDQGGQVSLKWVRSGYDVQGISTITDYLIQRSFPPDENGFSWENIATMPASNEPFYSFVAETPNDSMTNNSGTYYFRITARTSNPNEYWRSNIIYGHSTDNLAPLPPAAFYANLIGSDVHLGWEVNLESDFRDYYIYRSDNPVLDDFELLGTTTDTTFIDSSPLLGNAYYYVQAYDIHDNGSALAGDSVMAFLSANIKVLLEGSYDAGGMMRTTLNLQEIIPFTQPFNVSPWNYTGTETVSTVPLNVTDWILVELRSTETTVVDRRAAFLKNDGTLVDLDGVSNIKFPTATAGDYYVVIIHRNHLAVMTKYPVTVSFSPTFYDMTDIDNVYGTNAMKYLGGVYYGAYTADTDGSGTVNAADRSNTWNQRNLSGYYGTDVDLSGTVNAADRSAVWNNRNLSTQVPIPTDNPTIKVSIGGQENE